MLSFRLNNSDRITIGRGKANNICIDNKKVSSNHAVIKIENNTATIIDQNSTNGTKVNNRKIDQHKLSIGDRIQVGDVLIKYSKGLLDIDNTKNEVVIHSGDVSDLENLSPRTYHTPVNIKGNFLKIGRESNNGLLLNDKFVSRNHAVIEKKGKNYIVKDNNSTHGTFVDGQKVTQCLLREGAKIQIGSYVFYYAKGRLHNRVPDNSLIRGRFSSFFSETRNLIIAGAAAAGVILIALAIILAVNFNPDKSMEVKKTFYENGDMLAGTNDGASVLVSVYNGLGDCDVVINEVALDKTLMGANASVNAYDFNVANRQNFDGLLKLSIPYDADKITAGQNPDECVAAGYFNENTNQIEPVVYEVDQQNQRVIITTDHLSKYFAATYPDEQTKLAQINQEFAPDKDYADVIPKSVMPIHEENMIMIKAGQDVPLIKQLEIGFGTVNNTANVLSSGNSAIQKASELFASSTMKGYEYVAYGRYSKQASFVSVSNSSKYLGIMDDAFLFLGIALTATQFVIDLANDNEMAEINYLKNSGNLIGGMINGSGMIAATFLDYSLGYFKDGALSQEHDKYYQAYKAYYAEKHNKIHGEAYKKIKEIFEQNQVNGVYYETSITDEVNAYIDEYVNEYWNLPNNQQLDYFKKLTWGGTLRVEDVNDPLFKDIKPAITTKAKYDFVTSVVRPAVQVISERIVLQNKAAIKQQKAAMTDLLNSTWQIDIKEIRNIDSAPFRYAGGVVQLKSEIEGVPDKIFSLDDTGCHQNSIVFKDYYVMKPKTAIVYASQADYEAGQNGVAAEITLNGQSKIISINFGSNLPEFELKCDRDEFYYMGTAIFTIEPYDEDYRYVWSCSDTDSNSAQVRFDQTEYNYIVAEVYDEDDILIGSKSMEIYVEENELDMTCSNYTPRPGDAVTFELASKTIAFSECKVVWDLGEYYDVFEEFSYNTIDVDIYDTPGMMTANAHVYYIDEFGDETYLASAICQINIMPFESFSLVAEEKNFYVNEQANFYVEPNLDGFYYDWTISDGRTYRGVSISPIFSSVRTYDVGVVVHDGIDVYFRKNITIYVEPKPTPTPEPDQPTPEPGPDDQTPDTTPEQPPNFNTPDLFGKFVKSDMETTYVFYTDGTCEYYDGVTEDLTGEFEIVYVEAKEYLYDLIISYNEVPHKDRLVIYGSDIVDNEVVSITAGTFKKSWDEPEYDIDDIVGTWNSINSKGADSDASIMVECPSVGSYTPENNHGVYHDSDVLVIQANGDFSYTYEEFIGGQFETMTVENNLITSDGRLALYGKAVELGSDGYLYVEDSGGGHWFPFTRQ